MTAGPVHDGTVLVSTDSRSLRRELRSLVWVTLEEVALDAVAEDGRLVARTSARQVEGAISHRQVQSITDYRQPTGKTGLRDGEHGRALIDSDDEPL